MPPRLRRGFAIVVATLSLTISTAHASPPESTLAPPIDPPAPVVVAQDDDALVITGETLWTGLHDHAVILMLRDGNEARGTVVAQSADEVALARASDGIVVGIPKRDIANVRLSPRPEPQPEDKPGGGLIGGGTFMLAFGGTAALSGTVILGVFPEYTFIHLPLLLPGLAMVGGGAAMVAVGSKRRRAHARSNTHALRPRLTPIASIGNRSGHVGLLLRF
jgi:hypothetical protein